MYSRKRFTISLQNQHKCFQQWHDDTEGPLGQPVPYAERQGGPQPPQDQAWPGAAAGGEQQVRQQVTCPETVAGPEDAAAEHCATCSARAGLYRWILLASAKTWDREGQGLDSTGAPHLLAQRHGMGTGLSRCILLANEQRQSLQVHLIC